MDPLSNSALPVWSHTSGVKNKHYCSKTFVKTIQGAFHNSDCFYNQISNLIFYFNFYNHGVVG
jgi:hypothetical protein